MKTFHLILPALLVLAPPAMAQDWTGFSVGAQVGFADITGDDGMGDVDSGSGPTLGLRAYYDHDFGQVILGAGVQYDTMAIDVDGTDVTDIWRVGARIGVDNGQDWFYGTAGFANLATNNPGSGDSDGYFVGIGYERFLSQNLTMGAEVLFHEFDDFADPNAMVDVTTASLSLNWRF